MSLAGRPSVRRRTLARALATRSACHDGTPRLNIVCPGCGTRGHIHEGTVYGVHGGGLDPSVTEIRLKLKCCGRAMVWQRSTLDQAFGRSA